MWVVPLNLRQLMSKRWYFLFSLFNISLSVDKFLIQLCKFALKSLLQLLRKGIELWLQLLLISCLPRMVVWLHLLHYFLNFLEVWHKLPQGQLLSCYLLELLTCYLVCQLCLYQLNLRSLLLYALYKDSGKWFIGLGVSWIWLRGLGIYMSTWAAILSLLRNSYPNYIIIFELTNGNILFMPYNRNGNNIENSHLYITAFGNHKDSWGMSWI